MRLLAERAIVLVNPGSGATTADGDGTSGGGLLGGATLSGGTSEASGDLTLVAVTPAEAAALAGAASWASLSAVVVG